MLPPEAVETEGDAAVRGRTVAEGFEHVAETQLRFILRNLEGLLEDRLLHIGLVDADAAAAEFHAVDHDVVVLAADFLRVGLEQWDALERFNK